MADFSKPSDQKQFKSDRPRWAEEKRDKKQIKLRLPPPLIEEIDQKSKEYGVDRNAWITMAIRKFLGPR